MLNITHILQSHSQIISLLIIAAIIFTESAILLGFFLPGDTLLFTAGFFASKHYINIYALIATVVIAEVVGAGLGYYIGSKTGPKLFTKKNSLFFRREYLEKTGAFYSKNGGKAVVLAQFLPVVRTFSPVVAGFSEMKYKKFLGFNFVGAFLWATIIPILGYQLGHKINNIDKYILPIIIITIVISFAPALYHLFIHKPKKSN
jgi:membrane-associated protein